MTHPYLTPKDILVQLKSQGHLKGMQKVVVHHPQLQSRYCLWSQSLTPAASYHLGCANSLVITTLVALLLLGSNYVGINCHAQPEMINQAIIYICDIQAAA
jgi:hypothetical protein